MTGTPGVAGGLLGQPYHIPFAHTPDTRRMAKRITGNDDFEVIRTRARCVDMGGTGESARGQVPGGERVPHVWQEMGLS